jgi:hypothetical protein
VEKRHSSRFQVNLRISFERGIGIVRDLSIGGCQMESMVDIPTRDSLIMHVTLSPDEPPLTIDAARIHRCSEYRFSVTFLVMATKEKERLRLYLRSLEENKRPTSQ